MKELIVAAITFGAGFLMGVTMCGHADTQPGQLRVLTRVDTVRITSPPRVSVRYLKPDTVYLATAASGDSVRAVVPVEQAEYVGEGYHAYVSGYRPRLDSIVTVRSMSVSTQPVRSTPRLSFGLQAGYGLTPRGPQPYIGLGFTYTIAIGR